MMRTLTLFVLALFAATIVSCGGRKRDMAYYEHQIDSIRKAEQLAGLQQLAALDRDPVANFLDTLSLRTLPIQSEGGNYLRLGSFTDLPRPLVTLFGFPDDARMKAMALPRCHGCRVVMLAEVSDSISPVLYLLTLDKDLQPVDELCIYEQTEHDNDGEGGISYNEYYITSHYEITLLDCFQPRANGKLQIAEPLYYNIDGKGHFEECDTCSSQKATAAAAATFRESTP